MMEDDGANHDEPPSDHSNPEVTVATSTIRAEWGNGTNPSVGVVEAVATASDRDPLKLPPLYDHVAADALDQLLTSGSEVHISFRYAGCEVAIEGDGTIEVSVPVVADE